MPVGVALSRCPEFVGAALAEVSRALPMSPRGWFPARSGGA